MRRPPLAPAILLLAAGAALAQNAPNGAPPSPADAAPAARGTPPPLPGRRSLRDDKPTVLAFDKVTVDKLIPFIVKATGMVVMPQPDVLTRPITVVNDQEIPQEQALDLVFLALHQAGVAVVESGGVITLRDITEVDRQDVPVIGPRESVLGRGDLGLMAEKVYPLSNSTAEKMGELLKDAIPKYAKLSVDAESNQVAVMGNIALLQRMERLITSLDRPSSAALVSETFRLRYADAEQIKTNIEELFSAETGRGTGRNNQNQGGNRNMPQFFGGPGGQNQNQRNAGDSGPGGAAASANLRVTANTQQNAVTVVAEPAILQEVRDLIDTSWDLPLAPEAVVPRIYDLQNTDPIKMRDLLQQTFGEPEGVTGGGGGGGGGGGNNANRTTSGSGQGVGRLAGQFSFQAMPESGRLLVVAKSPDNMAVIDEIIKELDKPQTVGLPAIVELKHASAEELAEQLNALLSQEGTRAQIQRAESGLSDGGGSQSPFATQETTTDQDGNTTQETTSSEIMTFWWQQARPPTDSRGSSNLVAKVRLVPVWRQNALMVLAPPEYKNSIIELIGQLDQPGRQVLISAIVAEVSRDDATSLGLRWSSSAITPANAPDNSISIGAGARGTENQVFGNNLFDTSVLNVNANLNVILQALAQKTAVNILSEPKIFTSDNQEAEFFDGQDIPFVTDSQTNQQGNLVQSFDYRAVGIQLRARPRITPDRKVDLRVNLELSSIVPGQTLFGGFIVDRRETTTQVIVKNGQTIVISGILRSEDSNVLRKVPILGDIPILGAIFRSRDKTIKETELILFITPVVVDNVDDVDSVTQPLRGPLDTLRERFNWDEKKRGEAADTRENK